MSGPDIWHETMPTSGVAIEYLWLAAALGALFGIALVCWYLRK